MGIWTKLLHQIENEYRQHSTLSISLSVDQLNPAKKLYERLGHQKFAEAGTAVTMVKAL